MIGTFDHYSSSSSSSARSQAGATSTYVRRLREGRSLRRDLGYDNYLRAIDLDPTCMDAPYRPQLSEVEREDGGLARGGGGGGSGGSKRSSSDLKAAYIEVDEDMFEEDLMCPICRGVLDSTYTVMACLHRFCSECLHRSLRMELGPSKTSHECPSCRAKLPSRRSSKKDPLYDNIIQLFSSSSNSSNSNSFEYGDSPKSPNEMRQSDSAAIADFDLAKYRKLHEENVLKFRSISRENSLNGGGGGGVNALPRAGAAFSGSVGSLSLNGSSPADINSSRKPIDVNSLVACAIFPFYEESSLDSNSNGNNTLCLSMFERPYVRLPQHMRIADLKLYVLQLRARIIIVATGEAYKGRELVAEDLDLLFSRNNNYEALADEITMRDVCVQLWDKRSELKLLVKVNRSLSDM